MEPVMTNYLILPLQVGKSEFLAVPPNLDKYSLSARYGNKERATSHSLPLLFHPLIAVSSSAPVA